MSAVTAGFKEIAFDKMLLPVLMFSLGVIFANMLWSITHITQNEKDIATLNITVLNDIGAMEGMVSISQRTEERVRQLELDVHGLK